MTEMGLLRTRSGDEPGPAPAKDSDPTTSLQALIEALIEIDIAFGRESDTLSNSSRGTGSKTRGLKRLRERHRQQRQPYVEQLAALQEPS